MTVEEAIALLRPEELARLRFSFENHRADYVAVGEWFVGVYVDEIPGLVVTHQSGRWSTGRLSHDGG